MEVIEHYVFSSRKIENQNGKITYKKGRNNNKGADGALDYFNIGKYRLENFQTEYPTFITHNDYSEKDDFHRFPENFYLPKEHTKSVFEELFAALKPDDKMLYIYLHGFGNDPEKEMNKQIIPMTKSYYPHSNNAESPVGKLLFITWPSQGFTEYKHGEKNDVSKMGTMVLVFMLKLFYYVTDKNNPLFADWKPKIVFHSQSMGCLVLQTAMERLTFLENANVIKKNRLDNFFHRIVMTGADLSVNALKDLPDESGEEIHQLCKRVILFSNRRDFALWISRYIFGSGRRLGRHLDEESIEDLPENVELVELKKDEVGFIGHNYFTEEKDVATRLQNFLRDEHFDNVAMENRARKIVYNLDTGLVEEGKWLS